MYIPNLDTIHAIFITYMYMYRYYLQIGPWWSLVPGELGSHEESIYMYIKKKTVIHVRVS